MAHIRQSIRDNAVTAVTGLSTTNTNSVPLALAQCYQRGAEMIRDVSQRLPVVNATTVCVDVKDKQLPKPENGKAKPDNAEPRKGHEV